MASSTGSIMLKRDRLGNHWQVYYDNGKPGKERQSVSRSYATTFSRHAVESAVIDLCSERGLPEPVVEWWGGDMAYLYPKDAA